MLALNGCLVDFLRAISWVPSRLLACLVDLLGAMLHACVSMPYRRFPPADCSSLVGELTV